jgi:hypothetical protein
VIWFDSSTVADEMMPDVQVLGGPATHGGLAGGFGTVFIKVQVHDAARGSFSLMTHGLSKQNAQGRSSVHAARTLTG